MPMPISLHYKPMEAAEKAHPAYKAPTAVISTIGATEILLSKISCRLLGCDNIPYWVYRDCALVIIKIMNMSFGLGVVSAARLAPVPKCMPVKRVADLKSISVTPILSRLVERLVVNDHIFNYTI